MVQASDENLQRPAAGFKDFGKQCHGPEGRCIACGIQHCYGGRTECNIQCCMIAVPGIRSYLWSDATGVILIADDAAIPKVV